MNVRLGDYVLEISLRRVDSGYPGFPRPNSKAAHALLKALQARVRNTSECKRCTRIGLVRAAMEHGSGEHKHGAVAHANTWVMANDNWRDYVDPLEVARGDE